MRYHIANKQQDNSDGYEEPDHSANSCSPRLDTVILIRVGGVEMVLEPTRIAGLLIDLAKYAPGFREIVIILARCHICAADIDIDDRDAG